MALRTKLVGVTVWFSDGTSIVLKEGSSYVHNLIEAAVADGILRVTVKDVNGDRIDNIFNLRHVKRWEQFVTYKETNS